MPKLKLNPCPLVFLLLAPPLTAQHALVLSGGGARGLAHAGAIVALEELGYRPSFVVGTSMGAIIGAMYGAGFTADQIHDIVLRENWLELMTAAATPVGPDRELRRPLLGFGISSGRFYGSLLSAPGIDLRLIQLLFDAGVRARNDFDALPIPYRAVAADLSTGGQVVLGRGDLPRAVRASMAVPGAFAPVSWGNAVLIDGGVANNLPVSVARELTDLRVVAVDVLRPREEVEERSALDVALRSIRLLIENARPEAEADILVLPPVAQGFTETSFPADAADILRRGYEATRAQAPRVAPQPESRRAAGPAPARIAALRIDGADAAAERLIGRIMRNTVGDYDPQQIIEGTSALYRTGLFQSVWPRVDFDDGTDPVLVVEVMPVATTSVSLGAGWNNDVGGNAWVWLRQGVSLNTPVELRLAGSIDQLGQAGSLSGAFFSALLTGMVWTGGAHAFERRVRLLDGSSIAAHTRVRGLGGWVGSELRGVIPSWLFAAMARADHIREAGEVRGWAVGPVVRIARAPAPDRIVGVDPVLEAEARTGDVEYQRARLRLGQSLELAKWFSTGIVIETAVASDRAPADALPAVDRDIAPWLPAGTLPGRLLAAGGIDAAVPIPMNGHARVRLRALAGRDAVSPPESRDWRFGGEVGAIWPTVLGPVSIGAAIGQGAQWRFNISIGSTF